MVIRVPPIFYLLVMFLEINMLIGVDQEPLFKSLSANKQLWYNSHQRRWKNGEKELQVMDNIRCVLGVRKG